MGIALSILSMLSSNTEKIRPPDNEDYLRFSPHSPKLTQWNFHGNLVIFLNNFCRFTNIINKMSDGNKIFVVIGSSDSIVDLLDTVNMLPLLDTNVFECLPI